MNRLRLRSGAVFLGAIVASAFLLGACFKFNVSQDFQFKPGATKGLVFASMTVTGERPNALFLKYRKVGIKEKEEIPTQPIPVINSLMEMDWDPKEKFFLPDSTPAGRLMAIELPPGKYEFYAWHGTIPGYQIYSIRPFSYQFEAVAGRATYVGNIHLRFENRRYRMGLLENKDRDMTLLRKKVPKVREDEIDVKPMEMVSLEAPKPQ